MSAFFFTIIFSMIFPREELVILITLFLILFSLNLKSGMAKFESQEQEQFQSLAVKLTELKEQWFSKWENEYLNQKTFLLGLEHICLHVKTQIISYLIQFYLFSLITIRKIFTDTYLRYQSLLKDQETRLVTTLKNEIDASVLRTVLVSEVSEIFFKKMESHKIIRLQK